MFLVHKADFKLSILMLINELVNIRVSFTQFELFNIPTYVPKSYFRNHSNLCKLFFIITENIFKKVIQYFLGYKFISLIFQLTNASVF